MKVVFEEVAANKAEGMLQDLITKLVKETNTDDCRSMAGIIRQFAETLLLDMEIGCGGSHIYIHRSHQFVCGKNTDADNVRWAIITD